MFEKIFICLTVLLLLYYAVLVCMDMFIAPARTADMDSIPEEKEIDISEEACSFRSIEIRRDNAVTRKKDRKDNDRPSPRLRPPVQTNGLPVEALVSKARNIAGTKDTGLAGLGEIVARCESAP